MNNVQRTINLLLKDNNIPKQIKNLQDGFKQLDDGVKKLNQTINSTSSNMSGKLSGVGDAAKDIDTVIDKVTDNIQKKFDKVNYESYVNNTRNVFEALSSILAPSTAFQQHMANISAATGITGNSLDELSRIARQTGVSTGEGATSAAAAFENLASKVNINKVGLEGLKTLQQQTATLSQATGLNMNDTANVLAGTINQFGLSADEAARVVNVLAAGSVTGVAGINDLAASFTETARTATASGVSLEETTGALALLSQNNLKGAEAGTVLNNILTTLRTSLGDSLDEGGLSEALQTLQPLLTDTVGLTNLFGTENANTAAFLIANAEALNGMTASLTGANVAQEQAAIRSDTVAAQMERVKATIDDLKLSLFEATGGMTGYVSAVTDSAITVAQLLPLLNLMKGVMTSSTAATIASTVATTAKTVATKVASVATTVWTTVQRGLNLAMSANPIGLILTVVMALSAAVGAVSQRFGGFSNVLNGCKNVAVEFGSSLLSAILNPIRQLLSGLSSMSGALMSLLDGDLSKALSKAKEGAKDLALGTLSFNPVAMVGSVINNGNYADAWKKGLEGMEVSAGEIVPEIDAVKIQQEIANLTSSIPAVTIPVLGSVASSQAVAAGSVGAGVGEGVNTGKQDEQSLGVNMPELDLDNSKRQLDEFNKSVVENQEVVESQGSVWDSWVEKMQGMSDPMSMLTKGISSLSENMIQSFSQGADSLSGFTEQLGGVIRDTITGIISLGVSYMVMNALQTASFSGPFGFLVAPALAALAGGLATTLFNSVIPSFANGGIVYGNTLAQVGEYPGAANNPEVIAPLNKLRSLIQPANSFEGGKVEFVIKGQRLVGVLNKESNKGRFF